MNNRMILEDVEIIFSERAACQLEDKFALNKYQKQENEELIRACIFGYAKELNNKARYFSERKTYNLSFETNYKSLVDEFMLTIEMTKIDNNIFYIEKLNFMLVNVRVPVGNKD